MTWKFAVMLQEILMLGLYTQRNMQAQRATKANDISTLCTIDTMDFHFKLLGKFVLFERSPLASHCAASSRKGTDRSNSGE